MRPPLFLKAHVSVLAKNLLLRDIPANLGRPVDELVLASIIPDSAGKVGKTHDILRRV